MTDNIKHIITSFLPSGKKIKVWVLAPYVETEDDNINYYYDFSQSILEYTVVFNSLSIDWVWQPVSMKNHEDVINTIIYEKENTQFFPIVLNLCDGDEINGTPGVSIVKKLEAAGLFYSGADEYFYNITTSKIPMKKAFDESGITNAPWTFFHDININPELIFNSVGKPIIVKPAVSGGSMGVGISNVVDNKEDLVSLVSSLFTGYRGWNLTVDGLIAEQFIAGPEFTTFISGSYNNPKDAHIYTPVERVFHHSLPEKERFLSFDRLWEIYEDEEAMPKNENFYEYRIPSDATLIKEIKQISWDAFVATKGTGYTRVDIRMDNVSKKLFVLELNAQCGISEDENYTSIGAILRLSGNSFTALVVEILNDAIRRGLEKTNFC